MSELVTLRARVEQLEKLASTRRDKVKQLTPRSMGALESERSRDGMCLWDLRDVLAETMGVHRSLTLKTLAERYVLWGGGRFGYGIFSDWSDLLFIRPVTHPKTGKRYTPSQGVVRVEPGMQDAFMSRLRGVTRPLELAAAS